MFYLLLCHSLDLDGYCPHPPYPRQPRRHLGNIYFLMGGTGERARAPVGRPCNKGEGIAIQSIQYEGEGDAIHILKDASHRNNRE